MSRPLQKECEKWTYCLSQEAPLKMHLFSRQRDMGVADPSGKINGQKDIFLKAMMGIGQKLRMNPSLDST